MSTLTVRDIPVEDAGPAQRLRRTVAAVRVHFTWWGVHKTLTAQQKEEVGGTYGADARLLSAGKKIIDVRQEAFRRLTSLRTQIVSAWRGRTLPYVEAGVRLIRQTDVEGFVHIMEGFRQELTQAEAELNAVYDRIKADARQRLGRLYNPADYPAEIRDLFHVGWDFPSVEPPNYLMRLNPDLYQQEQERVARRFEEAVQLAEEAFLGEFSKLVSHLTERLSGGPASVGEVSRDFAWREPQRVEVGGEVAAHAVGADQHHRADAVFGGAADFLSACAGGRGLVLHRRGKFLDRRLGRIEGEVEIVEHLDRPVRPLPARAGLALHRSAGDVVHATSCPGAGRGPGAATAASNNVG